MLTGYNGRPTTQIDEVGPAFVIHKFRDSLADGLHPLDTVQNEINRIEILHTQTCLFVLFFSPIFIFPLLRNNICFYVCSSLLHVFMNF